MKLSICTTIKNRANILYRPEDLNPQEELVLTSVEKTLYIVQNENINNPNFRTVYQYFKQPSTLFKNFIISLASNNFKSNKTPSDIELVVTDWNSTDVDIEAEIKREWEPYLNTFYCGKNIKYTVIKNNETGFSRGRGLNIAAQHATGDVLFFIDTDMLFHDDVVISECIDAVNSGNTAWPVCYKANDPTNLYLSLEWAGYGNCMMSVDTFKKYGPWEEIPRWGGEDTRLYQRIYKDGRIFRKPFVGFIHQWHCDNLRTREQICEKI